ncbi:DUF1990 family protein [Amycolatopsis jiangsuensis]|uniref:Uncharacterized protein (UPF0548 family) n=1 Tax=Amycolatopsis jiangsuensis TaxID=1181879 RepID=A0A840IQ42_9PSEU|nr:DUF1990 family protein [Amycolatopsis jiangsuensis]MBB4683312.1 uncharacterized protein (UPF0548 family) [Amycolatopsis jiangsuensis]
MLPRLGPADPGAALAALRGRAVNYDPAEVRRPGWNIDVHRCFIADEPPGPAVPGGPWSIARALVRDYEFTPPGLVRAVYDPAVPLLGRELLLEGRFSALRFQMGVRITSLHLGADEEHDVFGWGYQTLDGHLERGEVVYRVIKHRATGRVEFRASSHSQADPRLGSVLRLGWLVFGRRTQLRFYRDIQRRLRGLVRQRLRPAAAVTRAARVGEGLASVPSGAGPSPWDRFALYSYDPARSRLPG